MYPPFAAVLLAPLYVLPEPLGYLLWTALNLSLLCGILYLCLRCGRPESRSSSFRSTWKWYAALLPLFLVFNVNVQHVVFGQINFIVASLCIADMLLNGRRRGFLIGIAAGIKLTPLLFIAFFVTTGRWRAAAWSCIGLASTVVVGLLFFPRDSLKFYTDQIFGLSGVVQLDGFFATSGNSSISGVSERLLGTHDVLLLFPALLAVVAVAFWSAHRFLKAGDAVRAVAIVGVAMCLLSPVSWLHHWIWLYPAVVSLLVGLRPARWCAYVIMGVCILQVTDVGDHVSALGGPEVVAEIMRSSMVLVGLLFITVSAWSARTRGRTTEGVRQRREQADQPASWHTAACRGSTATGDSAGREP